ncbi:MAG: class I SAM-dependent methyltransferase [Chloroflexi bacterium]|nr:class I SAM-dependent methyltransferase [Chloroflexota bacterium]MCL5275303.1 class I SAM-dependent methyltransferase [Chloroflexota bacterium]
MPSIQRRILRAVMQFGFRQLYGNFAWTYDAVAAVVSLGEWKAWGRAAIPFVCEPARESEPRLLEIAHGPGHLHLTLRRMGCHVVGIDLSPQMGALASQRLRRAGYDSTLARASVHRLPFADGAFDALISTFPTDFILAPEMAAEAWRVLAAGGRLVVVPNAPLRRAGVTGVMSALVGWWYRISRWSELDTGALRELYQRAGFYFSERRVPARRSEVIVWVCEKIPVTGHG